MRPETLRLLLSSLTIAITAAACNGSQSDRSGAGAAQQGASTAEATEPAGSATGSTAPAAATEAASTTAGSATTRDASVSGASSAAGAGTPDPASSADLGPSAQTTASGLRFVDVRSGDGPTPARGAEVTIRYSMWKDGGQVVETDQELRFPVGAGRVVRGLDEAVSTMRVGGRRRLVAPPALGYGQRGRPDQGLPPNATLTFDVELLAVEQGS